MQARRRQPPLQHVAIYDQSTRERTVAPTLILRPNVDDECSPLLLITQVLRGHPFQLCASERQQAIDRQRHTPPLEHDDTPILTPPQ
jgi:hypothetical protein